MGIIHTVMFEAFVNGCASNIDRLGEASGGM